MSFSSAATVQAEKFLEWANKWHQTVILWTIVGATFAIALGVLANMAGVPGFNFILAAIALLAGIFFLTKPMVVLSVFGFGSLTGGLPDLKIGEILKGNVPNFEIKKFLGAGWDAIRVTAHQVAHVFFFLTVLFVVLGTFPISQPALVLPALVILTGFGLWSALFAKGSIWYRRITIAILLVSGGVIFFKMYEPQKSLTERVEAAQEQNRDKLVDDALKPILRKAEGGYKLSKDENELLQAAKEREESRSLAKKAETFLRGRVIEYRVPSNIAPENLKPICGIPNGEYILDLADNTPLRLKIRDESGIWSQQYIDLKDHTRISSSFPDDRYPTYGVYSNGIRVGGKLRVTNGCISQSFNLRHDVENWFRQGTYEVEPTTLKLLLK